MLRLLRIVFALACLAGFAWFGATVPLGHRTLFGHLHALWRSPEGRDLEHGIAEKATEAEHAVRRDLADDPSAGPRAAGDQATPATLRPCAPAPSSEPVASSAAPHAPHHHRASPP